VLQLFDVIVHINIVCDQRVRHYTVPLLGRITTRHVSILV